MTGAELRDLDRTTSTAVVELLSEYRRKQDALREQSSEVARLFEEVLTAADREATDIVAHARADVRRIVVDAWRDVLALTTQLQAIAEGDGHEPGIGLARDRLIETRRELCHVLDEARLELESLEQTAARRPFSDPAAVLGPTGEVAVEPPAVESPRSDPEPAERAGDARPGRRSRLVGTAVAAFFVIAATVVTAALFFVAWADGRKTASTDRASAPIANARSSANPSALSPSPRSAAAASLLKEPQHGVVAAVVNDSDRRVPRRVGEGVTRDIASKPVSSALAGSQPTNQRLTAPPPLPVATGGTSTTVQPADDRQEIAARAERWLDAYYRGDGATTSSMSTTVGTISDERQPGDRLPPGLAVKRSLEGLTFQFAGDNAILSGRMIEQAETGGGESIRRISWISQMWTRERGEWKLMDVRMAGEIRRPPGPRF
jgi:hypothetical protein